MQKKTFCSLTTRCVHVISHEILKEFFASYMYVYMYVRSIESTDIQTENKKYWKEEKNEHEQKKTSCFNMN